MEKELKDMTERFTVDYDGKYWDKIENKYVTIDHLFRLVESLEKENEQLKQFQEQVASVIESKMGDNVCNDYKMEVLKEIWNELELDEVWFK